MLTGDEVVAMFHWKKAVWFFDYRRGDPTLPHAQLTSDLCADGYFRSDLVLQDTEIAERIGASIAEKLAERRIAQGVQWVVGSAYGGIVVAYEVARQLGAYHAYTVKDPANPKRQLWRTEIPVSAVVLRCEDVISTRGTVRDVERAIVENNPESVTVLSDVATIVCHPGGGIEDVDIVWLAATRVKIWHQSECPLCRDGSPRLPPKENWEKFVHPRA
jgi:orotate phosphoribosyltransferase